MAANMYRVGGEYRARGLQGPGREKLGAGTGEARPPAAWSRARTGTGTRSSGSEGCGDGDASRRPGSLRGRRQPRRHFQGCVGGPRVGERVLGKWFRRNWQAGVGREGPGATAVPLAGEPPGGFLSPGVIARRGSRRWGGTCATANNCLLR